MNINIEYYEYIAEQLEKPKDYVEYLTSHVSESHVSKEEKIRKERTKKIKKIFEDEK
jgi:hypothetical protein